MRNDLKLQLLLYKLYESCENALTCLALQPNPFSPILRSADTSSTMSTSKTRLFHLEENVIINAVISRPLQSKPLSPTLVFLHFWGGSSSTWSAVNAILSLTYPTVAIDFRGWGDSTGPPEMGAYSTSHLANDVEAVIKSLELDDFILIGLSMGAKIAQLIAGRNNLPGLKGAILVSPAPPTSTALPDDMREQQIHAYDAKNSAEFVAKNVLTASSPAEDVIQSLVKDMLQGNQWARAAWPSYVMAEDISDITRNIAARIPVLVVGAGKDMVEPVDKVRKELCDNIPGSTLVVLDHSGHLSPIDDPSGLAECISKFTEKQ